MKRKWIGLSFAILCTVGFQPFAQAEPPFLPSCDPKDLSTWNSVETLLNTTSIPGHPISCASCHAGVAVFPLIANATTESEKKFNLCQLFYMGFKAYEVPTSALHPGGLYNRNDLNT